MLVLHSSQYMMLQRNLLYTGLTRARDLCLLVSDKRALGRAVKNDKTTRRYTRLAERRVSRVHKSPGQALTQEINLYERT